MPAGHGVHARNWHIPDSSDSPGSSELSHHTFSREGWHKDLMVSIAVDLPMSAPYTSFLHGILPLL